MTKNELIKALAAFDGDACIIIDTGTQGWADVEEVKMDGCQIMITMGDHPENRDRQDDAIEPPCGENWYFVKLHQHTKKTDKHVDYFHEWAYWNGSKWEMDGHDETCRVVAIIDLKNPPF